VRLLLDTHILLWMFYEPERLSAKAKAALEGGGNELVASHAALWEISTKARRGKLARAGSSVRYILGEMEVRRVGLLPIKLAHILASEDLPYHHGDPFDRIMIAQALSEGLTLVTADAAMRRYDVPTLW
jgi:PIN domain nuclease of toxin-antitoxin system